MHQFLPPPCPVMAWRWQWRRRWKLAYAITLFVFAFFKLSLSLSLTPSPSLYHSSLYSPGQISIMHVYTRKNRRAFFKTGQIRRPRLLSPVIYWLSVERSFFAYPKKSIKFAFSIKRFFTVFRLEMLTGAITF